jgi:hypothetical protein
MADAKKNNNKFDEMSPVYQGVPPGIIPQGATPTKEYKVGHNRPPIFLIVLYIIVIIWCAISWIPFYGY